MINAYYNKHSNAVCLVNMCRLRAWEYYVCEMSDIVIIIRKYVMVSIIFYRCTPIDN